MTGSVRDADRRPVRVLLAKPGLDGHDRGVKVIAMALRDAGAEVIYLGMRRSAQQIAEAAVAEDVDVIGLSILSGAHVALCEEVMEALRRAGGEGIAVLVGGTIPDEDRETLRALGVAAVFPVGSDLRDLVDDVLGRVAT